MLLNRFSIVTIYLLAACYYSGLVSASFYCDDVPASCKFNAYGWQNTCGPSCTVCGEVNCPAEPEIATLSMLSQSNCRVLVIKSNRLRRCNSALINNPSIRAYSNVFNSACEEHSICYHNNGYSKQRCDDHFEVNIQQICRSLFSQQPRERWWLNEMNQPGLEKCLSAASVWSANIKESGAGTYSNDQNWAVRYCPIE